MTALKHLGLPTLKYGQERNNMIQVYKIMKGIDKLDVNTSTFFQDANGYPNQRP